MAAPRILMARIGRPALAAVGGLCLILTACGTSLPPSVIEGSTVKVGWSGDLTSLNAGSRHGATPGNVDVAATTRGQFARLVDGDVVADKRFGNVKVVNAKPAAFTVRYDLKKVSWSDGVPVDAADLLLAWAAGSNALTPKGFDSLPSELTDSSTVPSVDDFGRSIDVRFRHPVTQWHTALDIAVPAHVVGQRALRVEDPMEAKQAVMKAIRGRDQAALAKLVRVWNTGFDLAKGATKVSPGLLVSSGPYRLEKIERADDGKRRLRLVANGKYVGIPSPRYEHIDLVPGTPAGQLADVGLRLDVVQLAPTEENWSRVRERDQRDYGVATSHDGRMWVLALRADRGVFRRRDARMAFLRAVPVTDLISAGAGPWRQAYSNTSALLLTPGTSDYGFAIEDSGFITTFQGGSQADLEFAALGLPAGTPVCVLYDRDEPFAKGAFGALKTGVTEAGWGVRDCGAADVDKARRGGGWDAVLTRVDVPTTPEEVAAQWGSRGARQLSGFTNRQRDRLIGSYARTPGKYDAQEALIRIEASLVSDALARPLAMQPLVTVSDRDIDKVEPRPGRWAPLTTGAALWSPDRK